ncbi:MAG: Uma2 family endonuclease [Planctomycetes bacterium]|nr:Uma2 family endonuclease [Planctomycetota bacterium]
MVRRHRVGAYRFADFLELVQADQKADLIDGAIYMASPENTQHNAVVAWLGALLQTYVEAKQLGRLMVNKVAFRLTDLTSPEPDLAVVLAHRLSTVKHGYVDGPPDVAIEVVSPDSVERDYEDKRLRYEEAGVAEYWILDPGEKCATFLLRPSGPAAAFTEAALEGTVFRSRALPGFWLDSTWVWSETRPTALSVIQRLLQEPTRG